VAGASRKQERMRCVVEKDLHYLSSDRKTKIHFHEWLPEGHPKAVVQLSHGITEHIGRYGKLAEELVAKNYAVAGNDHLGHGKSEQPECYKWEYLVKDTHRLQDYLRQQYPTVPYYVIGFSLGSFVIRDIMSHYPDSVDAAILIGTGFQDTRQLSFAKRIASVEAKRVGDTNNSKLIQKLSFGTYNRYFKPNKTEFDWLCADFGGLDNYMNDKACGKYMPAGLFRELLRGMILTGKQESYGNIRTDLPILMLSGDKDPVGEMGKGVERLQKAYQDVGINDVSLNLYSGRHDILHEACREHVFGDIVGWLEELYWKEYL